jgi:hypothetical protein
MRRIIAAFALTVQRLCEGRLQAFHESIQVIAGERVRLTHKEPPLVDGIGDGSGAFDPRSRHVLKRRLPRKVRTRNGPG